MEEDEEEPEEEESEEEETKGTRAARIEVVAEVVVPREVPRPVGGKEKVRVEELTARPLPRSGDEFATPIGQWASGPPKDKRRVVVDDGQARVDRRERREEDKGEDDKSRTPEERSTEKRVKRGRCRCLKTWRSRR